MKFNVQFDMKNLREADRDNRNDAIWRKNLLLCKDLLIDFTDGSGFTLQRKILPGIE